MEVIIDGVQYVPRKYPKIGELNGHDVHKGMILWDRTKEFWNIPVDYISIRGEDVVFVSQDGRELLLSNASFNDYR